MSDMVCLSGSEDSQWSNIESASNSNEVNSTSIPPITIKTEIPEIKYEQDQEQDCFKMDEDIVCLSGSEDSQWSNIESASNEIISTPVAPIPAKSGVKYEQEYKKFEDWCTTKNVQGLTEKVLLTYFSAKAQCQKPSTLWTHYSMLRATISAKKNVDISQFTQLIALLKKSSKGYKTKKSKTFTKDDIHRFLVDADDDQFLMIKLVLIIGIFGACRREELTYLKFSDIEDKDSFVKISIPCTKTKIREFVITEGNITGVNCLQIYRKYVQLRPPHATHDRFFVYYKSGKCTSQPVGINTFGNIPKVIARHLRLLNPEQYTGHCFRRSSASLLDDRGTDIQTLKRLGVWQSSRTTREYIESPLENNKHISESNMGENEYSNIQYSNINITTTATSGVQLSNCSNCVINIYSK